MFVRRLGFSAFALALSGAVALAQGQPAKPGGPAPAPQAQPPQPTKPEERKSKTEGPTNFTFPGAPVAFIEGQAKGDQGGKAIDDAFEAIFATLEKAKIQPVGPPMLQYFPEAADNFRFKVMVPLASPPSKAPPSKVKFGRGPSGKALKFVHVGTPEELDSTYELIDDYMEKNKLQSAGTIEEYASDPEERDESKQVTNVYVLLK